MLYNNLLGLCYMSIFITSPSFFKERQSNRFKVFLGDGGKEKIPYTEH